MERGMEQVLKSLANNSTSREERNGLLAQALLTYSKLFGNTQSSFKPNTSYIHSYKSNQLRGWAEEFVVAGIATEAWDHSYLTSIYLLGSNFPFFPPSAFPDHECSYLPFFSTYKKLARY